MIKKYLFLNNRGISLVETAVVLALLGLVTGLVYSLWFAADRSIPGFLRESPQRNEIRAVSAFFHKDIRYSQEIEIAGGGEQLLLRDGDDKEVTYKIEEDSKGNRYLTRRQNGSAVEFREIKAASFELENKNRLVVVRLETADENIELKIYRWFTKFAEDETLPDGEFPGDDLYAFLIGQKVLLLANRVEITGSSTVMGEEATVIIKEGISFGSARVSYIETKKIYIEGDVSLDGSAELGSYNGSSEIYVKGNISVTGGNRGGIYGHLFYTGNLVVSPWIRLSAVAVKVHELDFSPFNVPELKPDVWYAEKGYTSDGTPKEKLKFFGENYTFPSWGTYTDVIIASKEDITLPGNVHVTGILFAPEGKVEISGSSTFQGVIIANTVSVQGNAKVNYQSMEVLGEFPF